MLATQNPIEQEGTYPLPEAQLDRFMFNILVDYPSESEERRIVETTTAGGEPQLTAVLSARDIVELQQLVRRVPVAEHVLALRGAPGPREPAGRGRRPTSSASTSPGAPGRAPGSTSSSAPRPGRPRRARYAAASRTCARWRRRVLRHRIITNFNAEAEGVDADAVVARLLAGVAD